MHDKPNHRAPHADPRRQQRVRLEGTRKQALETGRNRLLVTGVVFALAFLTIAGRLVGLTVLDRNDTPHLARAVTVKPVGRAAIVDRNGVVLAASLPTASLYADPDDVIDADEAADKLVRVLPDLTRAEVVAKLTSPVRFVWLKRNLTPKQQYDVNGLGIPGLRFRATTRRVYPHGPAAAHVLGFTDIDGRGIAGVERRFDEQLRRSDEALRLSIDIRVQALLREELSAAMREFRAIGAAGVIVDVRTGETVALVSLPDFDPNHPLASRARARFNRATKGVYEMGSTFKLFTAAMALDSGAASVGDRYDARKPIHVARFTISDYHAKNRWLSVPEILIYSSNIGAAKMAMDVGTKEQRAYLADLGLSQPSPIELPEVGQPLEPEHWREINTMTVAYGHGIAVSPVQVADAVATLVDGGVRHPVTLLKRSAAAPAVQRVLSTETSDDMRQLMRLVVTRGTGRKADTPGYRIGGKTGTAEKTIGGGYRAKALVSSFVGAFPMDAPRYVVLALLDEPKGDASTFQYATGGWVAAPVVGRVVRRMAPLVGIPPEPGDAAPLAGRSVLASLDARPANAGGQAVAAR